MATFTLDPGPRHYFPYKLPSELIWELYQTHGKDLLILSSFLRQFGDRREIFFSFSSSETGLSPFEMSFSDIFLHGISVGGERQAFLFLFCRWGNRGLGVFIYFLLAKKTIQSRAGTSFHEHINSDWLF